MNNVLNPKITMLTTRSRNHIGQVSGIKVGDVIPTTKGGDVTVLAIDSYKDGWLSGNVVLNGQEWVVKPFEIKKGASARDKENALLKQAIKGYGE